MTTRKMKKPKDKKILDVACGGRMFWFDRKHPNVIYVDNRKEKWVLCDGRKFEVKPDRKMDFRKLKFTDKSFKLVVFDPPHLKVAGQKGWQSKKYGVLGKNWQKDLTKGFDECWRVLDDYGVLIFKWNEYQIKVGEVLKLFKEKPLFGHPTKRNGMTHWMCFMKLPK